MKKILFLVIVALSFTQCIDRWHDEDYSGYKPVLMNREMLENSIEYSSPRQMCTTGKIYFKDNYIYINEQYYGIHVIDNSNPSSPQNIGFISVPGSVDLAMKNNILYVDNSIDLLAIDLSNGVENMVVTKRIKDVFPEFLPPDGKILRSEFRAENRPEGTYVVAWEEI